MIESRDKHYPFSGAKLEDIKQVAERAREATKEVIEAARACLNTPAFQEYREKYIETERLLVQTMIDYVHNDPHIFYVEMCTMQTNIRTLRILLNEVERDARTK